MRGLGTRVGGKVRGVGTRVLREGEEGGPKERTGVQMTLR